MVNDLRIVPVRRVASPPTLADPAAETRRALAESGLLDRVAPGGRVAVAVGTRAIPAYPAVVRAVVDELRRRRLDPYVVAAAGSHGGATADGQRATLAGLGLTERAVGAPLDTSMADIEIARTADGRPVFTAAAVRDADAILAINRIKRHTAFQGEFGSGIVKLLAVGLGKRRGAAEIHAAGLRRGLGRAIVDSVVEVIRTLPVVGGIALLDHGRGGLARVAAVAAAELLSVERELLAEADRLQPSLGFAALDVLMLDQIGKDISGTGMDPWVLGRLMSPYPDGRDPDSPRIARVYARGLSPATGGQWSRRWAGRPGSPAVGRRDRLGRDRDQRDHRGRAAQGAIAVAHVIGSRGIGSGAADRWREPGGRGASGVGARYQAAR